MREIGTRIMRQTLSKFFLLLSLGGVILGFFLLADRFFSDMEERSERIVQIGNETYMLERADTEILRREGLGGREVLCEACGMLFVFNEPGRYAFWMKDMRFPLTLIWLDGERVVFIARDVSPDFSGVIEPPLAADRVIEINAGRATELMVGDQVQFFP